MLGAGLLPNMVIPSTPAVSEISSDSSSTPDEVTVVPDTSTDSDESSDIVENPTQPLPDSVDESNP